MAKRTLNGWVDKAGPNLPQEIVDAITAANGFKYGNGDYCEFLQKDDKWIVVTPDGGYYKTGAYYSVWNNISGQVGMQCIWSNAALNRTLKSLRVEGKLTRDLVTQLNRQEI